MVSAKIEDLNLKVVLVDNDYYALQSVNSYLAWDRRTRVTFMAEDVNQMWEHLNSVAVVEQPDLVLMAVDFLGGPTILRDILMRLRSRVEGVKVLCLSQLIEPEMIEIAAESGAVGYLLKQEVRLQIAWAIVYALEHDFIITSSIARVTATMRNTRLFNAATLPDQRDYPELTDRIRQALQLCVVEGMPAHLAAHEMGISLHTIRGYIKEGYRIMESHDDTTYPVDMTPQERAFMRFTAFEEIHDDGVLTD